MNICYCGSPARFPCRTCGRTQPEPAVWTEEPTTHRSTRKGLGGEANPAPKMVAGPTPLVPAMCLSKSHSGLHFCTEPLGHKGAHSDDEEVWT